MNWSTEEGLFHQFNFEKPVYSRGRSFRAARSLNGLENDN